MLVLDLLSDARRLAREAALPELQQQLARIEQEVQSLLREKAVAAQQCQQHQDQFAARLARIRHAVAQPLSTVQIFLELLPEIVKQETWGSGILVRPDFWRNRHQQAVEAIKTIPRILTSE